MPPLLDESNAVDWTWITHIIAHLSREYDLRVLADLTGMPMSMADCPAGDQDVWTSAPHRTRRLGTAGWAGSRPSARAAGEL